MDQAKIDKKEWDGMSHEEKDLAKSLLQVKKFSKNFAPNLRRLRETTCTGLRFSGHSMRDCLKDIAAYNQMQEQSPQEEHEHIESPEKQDQVQDQVQDKEEQHHIDEENEEEESEESTPKTDDTASSRQPSGFPWFLFVSVVFVVIAMGVDLSFLQDSVKDSLKEWAGTKSNHRSTSKTCRERIAEWAETSNDHQLKVHLNSKDTEAWSKLVWFVKRVGHDWSDKKGEGPKGAVGIRVQGLEQQDEVNNVVMRDLLRQALGDACYRERVLSISLLSDATPEATAGKFLKKIKTAKGTDAVAFVLLEHCSGRKEIQKAMHFKSFLEASFTTDDDQILSGRGVGFVFMGNSLPRNTTCQELEIQRLDKKNGWAENMRSRMESVVGLCKQSPNN